MILESLKRCCLNNEMGFILPRSGAVWHRANITIQIKWALLCRNHVEIEVSEIIHVQTIDIQEKTYQRDELSC